MRKFILLTLFGALMASGCANQAGEAKSNGASAGGESANGQVDAGPSEPARASAGEVPLVPENTTIEFVGSKPDGSSHDGGFRDFSGRIELDEKQKPRSIDLQIQTKSLWADNAKLENHLKSADFFSVREYPTAQFQSRSIESDEAGRYTVTGDLTLLGKTQEVTFSVIASLENGNHRLDSEFSFDRTRFGMNYGEGQINKDVLVKVTVGAKSQGTERTEPDEDKAAGER